MILTETTQCHQFGGPAAGKNRDFVRPRNEKLIERYVEVMGRVTALVVGTYSIEMIMQGLIAWADIFNS